ncbi:MAG: glutathione S-transferase [Pseudomonadota bacterium]
MKLYHSGTSPYVRKVMVTLHLTGQTGAVDLIPGSGTPLEPNAATAAANPLGKIPCLVTEEGLSLYDSRVVCRYLDWRGSAGLYPEGAALFPVLAQEALADGIIDAALLAVYEGRLRPVDKQFPDWVASQLAKCAKATAALEAQAASLNGPVTAGHIAVGCALGYLDLRHGDLGWRAAAPALAAWFEAFAATPAMVDTAPPA